MVTELNKKCIKCKLEHVGPCNVGGGSGGDEDKSLEESNGLSVENQILHAPSLAPSAHMQALAACSYCCSSAYIMGELGVVPGSAHPTPVSKDIYPLAPQNDMPQVPTQIDPPDTAAAQADEVVTTPSPRFF